MRSISYTASTAMLLTLCLAGVDSYSEELIQNSQSRASHSLDGDWHVIVDPYENGYYNHRYEEKSNGFFVNARAERPSDLVEYDFSISPTLRVPGDWNSQAKELFWYEGTVWYQRDFIADKQPGKRYVLRFGAVNYEANVYVNGTKVGRHEGGFTAFQFDVTDALADGDNFVVVKVDNRRDKHNVPALNTDWWNYGGITRSVTLLELDATYVADYFIHLDQDRNDAIRGWVRLAGTSRDSYDDVRLSIPELDVDTAIRIDEQGHGVIELAAQPELWSPDQPRRYEVRISYAGETVTDLIGFRRIAVSGEDILLNGESIYLRGVSIHEEAPLREGRAWSEQDARQTLQWARELGCNFVRLAHYPHNEAIVRLADELGLLVWSELPVYWTIDFDSGPVYHKAERQLREMISRDKNRAAIVLWSVANETPNNEARLEFLGQLVARTRALDSTRLITAANDTHSTVDNVTLIDDPLGDIIDVIGVNSYCGWYHDKPANCATTKWRSNNNKPVIVSEFGAGALQSKHGAEDERWTEEYQAAVYRHNLTMLDNMPFVRGTTPWILKDFRSPRRPLPVIQDYWNRKGLLSEKGERKQAWYVLHDYYEAKSSAR